MVLRYAVVTAWKICRNHWKVLVYFHDRLDDRSFFSDRRPHAPAIAFGVDLRTSRNAKQSMFENI